MVKANKFEKPNASGSVLTHDIGAEYMAHIAQHAAIVGKPKIAIDYANAMGIVEHRALAGLFDEVSLFGDLDGDFPNHEANPLNLETLSALQKAVVDHSCDFGIAYDGDADRGLTRYQMR